MSGNSKTAAVAKKMKFPPDRGPTNPLGIRSSHQRNSSGRSPSKRGLLSALLLNPRQDRRQHRYGDIGSAMSRQSGSNSLSGSPPESRVARYMRKIPFARGWPER